MSGFNEKIFGIGLGRTGTTSLADALNHLNIVTTHFPADQITQAELLSGAKLTVLTKSQGLVDGIAPFYPQLFELYPTSRFILTVRESTDWLASVNKFNKVRSEMQIQHKSSYKTYSKKIRSMTYGDGELDDQALLNGYNNHLSSVKKFFSNSPESLLTMNICAGDSWEELTSFLGISNPDAPFPQSNNLRSVSNWRQLVLNINETLHEIIGTEELFILVDENQLDLGLGNAQPFIERDGKYWGPPSDDAMAINELHRAIGSGVRFIAFTQPAFWWLDYYSQFSEYLALKCGCIFTNENIVIYKLNENKT